MLAALPRPLLLNSARAAIQAQNRFWKNKSKRMKMKGNDITNKYVVRLIRIQADEERHNTFKVMLGVVSENTPLNDTSVFA